MTGEDENSGMLFPLLEGYHIFCMTPQILLNNMERNSDSSLATFSLLIFDECHHTKKDDPYNKVMRRYLQEKIDTVPQLPQVVIHLIIIINLHILLYLFQYDIYSLIILLSDL